MSDKLPSLDMIRDIAHMSDLATQLLGKGKKYEKLLKHLLSLNLIDEDATLPAIKDISSALGLSYSQIRKLLTEIYEDLTGYEHEHKIEKRFDKVSYVFRVHAWEKHVTWTVHSLAHIPRVGEQMSLPFFKATLDFTTFYVDSITHDLYNGEQIVNFSLVEGYYNKFWHIRKDEAELKREISLHDASMLSNWQLRQKLGY